MGSTKARCQGWVNQNDCDKANYSDLQRAKNVPPKTKAECETGCGNRGIGVRLFPKIANCGNPNSPEGFDRGDLGNRADVSADVVTLRTISNLHPPPPPGNEVPNLWLFQPRDTLRILAHNQVVTLARSTGKTCDKNHNPPPSTATCFCTVPPFFRKFQADIFGTILHFHRFAVACRGYLGPAASCKALIRRARARYKGIPSPTGAKTM